MPNSPKALCLFLIHGLFLIFRLLRGRSQSIPFYPGFSRPRRSFVSTLVLTILPVMSETIPRNLRSMTCMSSRTYLQTHFQSPPLLRQQPSDEAIISSSYQRPTASSRLDAQTLCQGLLINPPRSAEETPTKSNGSRQCMTPESRSVPRSIYLESDVQN